MTEDTYYTVLGIPESATQDEIKRAYRDLIRQVHPDSVPNASAYWKRAAEERSKEINEAYHVLTDSAQRSSYDEQLAEYRRQQTAPAPPPAPPPTGDVAPPPLSHGRPQNPARPEQRSRRQTRRRYDWQPLKRWAGNYPALAGCIIVLLLAPVIGLFAGLRQNRTAARDDALASEGFYSAFPCLDPRDTVSPIDGRPCRKPEGTTLASENADARPRVSHTYTPAPTAPASSSYSVHPCGGTETPCKASATPQWFYIAQDGVHPLGGEPDDDTCKRIDAKSFSTCKASLRFCPRGVWSRDCVSYAKWKRSVDPPRVEKAIPEWPAQ
jgi:hypothetical protein